MEASILVKAVRNSDGKGKKYTGRKYLCSCQSLEWSGSFDDLCFSYSCTNCPDARSVRLHVMAPCNSWDHPRMVDGAINQKEVEAMKVQESLLFLKSLMAKMDHRGRSHLGELLPQTALLLSQAAHVSVDKSLLKTLLSEPYDV